MSNWWLPIVRGAKRKGRTRRTQERDAKIIEMRRAGFSNPQIAVAVDMNPLSLAGVLQRLIKAGHVKPHHSRTVIVTVPASSPTVPATAATAAPSSDQSR